MNPTQANEMLVALVFVPIIGGIVFMILCDIVDDIQEWRESRAFDARVAANVAEFNRRNGR